MFRDGRSAALCKFLHIHSDTTSPRETDKSWGVCQQQRWTEPQRIDTNATRTCRILQVAQLLRDKGLYWRKHTSGWPGSGEKTTGQPRLCSLGWPSGPRVEHTTL